MSSPINPITLTLPELPPQLSKPYSIVHFWQLAHSVQRRQPNPHSHPTAVLGKRKKNNPKRNIKNRFFDFI